jgi:hypothetical protein
VTKSVIASKKKEAVFWGLELKRLKFDIVLVVMSLVILALKREVGFWGSVHIMSGLNTIPLEMK